MGKKDKLPKGWKETVDPSGRQVWFNSKTNEMTYDHPSMRSERNDDDGGEMSIGMPMNVRHEGHIGMDGGGFKMSFTPEMANQRGTEHLVRATKGSARAAGSSRRETMSAPRGGGGGGGAQIFISYVIRETGAAAAGGDGFVPWLLSALEREGYSAFVGESQLKGGQEWGARLEAAIRACELFVPVVSATYGHHVESKWTYREFYGADNLGKAFIPLWLGGAYPGHLGFAISGTQYIDFRGWAGGNGAAAAGAATPADAAAFDELLAQLRHRRILPARAT